MPRPPTRLPAEEIARRKTPAYAIEQFLDAIPFLKGKLIKKQPLEPEPGQILEAITLGTTETKLNTGLSKEVTGYIVLSQDAAASIYKVDFTFPPPANEDERKAQENERRSTIRLKASAPVTAKIWVF